MSIVHVLISPDPTFEQAWREAYGGAVDVYRFATLAEGMQRLTSAQSPLDLLVVERSASESFGLTIGQCVHRLLQPPLANSRMLSRMSIVVIGGRPGRRHDRVRVVSSRDAAIRLVKFGEVERPVHRSQQSAHPVSAAPVATTHVEPAGSATEIAASVISRIWDAADRSAQPASAAATPTAASQPAQRGGSVPEPGRVVRTPRGTRKLRAGGPSGGHIVGKPRGGALFVHDDPQLPGTPMPAHSHAPAAAPYSAGHSHPMHAADETAPAPETFYQPGQPLPAEMGGLQPARPFQQHVETQFRGSGLRGSYYADVARGEAGAIHQPVVAAAPIPPALASQVGSLIYGSPQADPVLSFSRGTQSAAPMIPGQHMPGHHILTESLLPPAPTSAPSAMVLDRSSAAQDEQRGGMFSRIRSRIAAGERAPTQPSPEAIARATQARSAQGTTGLGVEAAPQSASSADASGRLLARADVDSAASFG